MNEIQKFMDENRAWSDKTFPGATATGALRHLRKEADEAIEAIEQFRLIDVFYELADCYILLLQATSRLGLTIDNLHSIAKKKMEENRKREWGKVNEQGFAEHIKTKE